MKILLVEPNWIGDVIFTTPAVVAVLKRFPNASVDCVLPRRCRDIFKYNPFVSEVIDFNEKDETSTLVAKVKFLSGLRARKYDTAILLHRSFTRTFLCSLAGIRRLAGYDYPKRSFLLTEKVPVVDKDSMHKQDYYLNILTACGIPVENKECRVYISGKERKNAVEIIGTDLSPGLTRVAINPFTNWAPKNWPIEHYAEFIKTLKERFPRIIFYITSATFDQRINLLLNNNSAYVRDLSGKTTLLELAGLYEKMDLVVSGDSGPLHLAAAVNTPYLGIYGPTSPSLTGVRSSARGTILFRNSACRLPCYTQSCAVNNSCMRDITPEEAVRAAINILNQKNT